MAKNAVKISILVIWLGLMGWWWAESRTWPTPEKVDAAFLPDYNDYFSLAYNGQKIGWSSRSLLRLSGGDYQLSQNTAVRLLVGDEELDIQLSAVSNLDKSLNLLNFTYLLKAGPLTVSESGEVAGGRLSLVVNLGPYGPLVEQLLADYGHLLGNMASRFDFGREAVIEAPQGPGLAYVLPAYLSHLGLEVGRNYSLQVLDPLTRTIVSLPVRIEGEGREFDLEIGREVPAFKLRIGADSAGGTEMWVDRFGRVYRESSYGLSMTRADTLFEANKGLAPLILPPSFQRFLNTESLKNFSELLKEARPEEASRTAPAGPVDPEGNFSDIIPPPPAPNTNDASNAND